MGLLKLPAPLGRAPKSVAPSPPPAPKPLVLPGITNGGFHVSLAGQDISNHIQAGQQVSIQDTLGQGPGQAAGTSGRATTCKFRTDLGPAASAYGAGQTLPTGGKPVLVRQGEVKVYDSVGNCVFGGYVTVLDDQVGISETGKQVIYTDVEAHDYWQDWDRINIVTEVFDGQTDVWAIRYLVGKYAPGVHLDFIPTSSSFQLGPMTFKNMSLQKALLKIADKTGNAFWIDPNKYLHYAAPGQFATAPFSLAQNPDFRNSFQLGFDDYTIDDTGAINRVTFYGGKTLSQDFYQDLSIQANGSNTTLTLAYYPHKSSDGFFYAYNQGSWVKCGYYGSTGAANQLIKDGGTAKVLINTDAHTLIFDPSWVPTNTGPSSVQAKYRYETPLVVQVVDYASVSFYGRYLDGTIADDTVFDQQTAVNRCRLLLSEQSMGLTTLKVRTWQAGLQSGQVIRVDHDSRNIHEVFLIQEVDITHKGGGHFEYQLTCGAWAWNISDFMMVVAHNAAPQDTTETDTTDVAQIESVLDSVNVHDTWTTQTRTTGAYKWRTTPANDGHDIALGLWSW